MTTTRDSAAAALPRTVADGGRVLLWAAAALLVALPFLWAPVSLQLPLGRDQGIFAWVGEVVLDGGLPYADAWEVKGPLVHFLYALALLLFGKTEVAVRAFDLIVLAGALLAWLRLGRLGGSRTAGLLGFALMFVLFGGDFWISAQPDGWAGIMLLGMTVVLLGWRHTEPALLAAGLLLGAAALIKPPYALFGLLPLVLWLAGSRQRGLVALLALVAAGALLAIGAGLLAFALAGKLGALWETLILFDLQGHFAQHDFDLLLVVRKALKVIELKYAVVIPIAAIGGIALWPRARAVVVALAAGAVLAFVVAVAQNKFYEYQFMPFDVFLGGLAGFGIRATFDAVAGRAPFAALSPPARLGMLAAALAVLAAAWAPAERVGQLWRHALGAMPEARWQALFCPYKSRFCHHEIVAVTDMIRAETAPGTPIFLWGFDAIVYFLADRPSATRLGYNYPMVAGLPESRQRMRAELMADLARTPPAFIVVQVNNIGDLLSKTAREFLAEFPALTALIATGYEPVLENSSFILYRARPGS